MTQQRKDEEVQSQGSGPRPRPEPEAGIATRYDEGDIIDSRYRLGKRLGEGGMGEVWLAHNETLDIDVAIKLIRAGNASTADHADRLLNEARAAARLGHPAIVRVNDFGKTDRGDPFIVMELLEGEDLAAALDRRGRLSAAKAVRTVLPIAHALTVAHTKGIVHRDLKPENIFLAQSDDGPLQPKLVDFGVAKLEARRGDRVTGGGALLGSPLYMAPEQARGDDVDHRADIWALAVVLYEMITGRPPFEGKNYNAVLYSIIANPPTPTTELGAGDEELWSVLDRAFQKDPDRRWYSMRDFGEALATWLEDHDVHEDITGASIQSTWLQWRREDADRLGPPAADSGELEHDAATPFPPPPRVPVIGRSREITVRTRRSQNTIYLLVGAAAAVVLVTVFALMALFSQEETVVPDSRLQASVIPAPTMAERNNAVPENAPPTASPAEQADPPLAPSALPIAAAEQAAAPPQSPSQHRPAPRSPPAETTPAPRSVRNSGIVTKNPYGSGLKNPFD